MTPTEARKLIAEARNPSNVVTWRPADQQRLFRALASALEEAIVTKPTPQIPMPTNPRDLIGEARAEAVRRDMEAESCLHNVWTSDLIERLADALEEALADTERLDWLFARCSEGNETPIYESLTGWRCIEPMGEDHEPEFGDGHETPRAAIDAARGKP